jgi:hypothetical protein
MPSGSWHVSKAPTDSDVPGQALSAQSIALLQPCWLRVWAIDRAGVRAGPEDVGDQTLIRGLGTAFPSLRASLKISRISSIERVRKVTPI